jgi:hypothetical protein
MLGPTTPVLSALRLAASEVALAGSFKKMAKLVVGRGGRSSGTGGRSPRAAGTLKRGTAARPRAAVTAHRLSVGSSGGSFASDGERSGFSEGGSSLGCASDLLPPASPTSDGLSSHDCFSSDGSTPSVAAGGSVRGSGWGEQCVGDGGGTDGAAAPSRPGGASPLAEGRAERLVPMAKAVVRRASRLGRSLSGNGWHAPAGAV